MLKKLDREILKTDYGVSYGSVTLKSLQNDNIPELDLLVREAIQNSSDASLKQEGKSYAVNFSTGGFVPAQFNALLTGLENILNKRYSKPEAVFLEIRDTKTSGLTGKIRKAEINKDDHGNFFKMIFDTGKRQIISTAGGNWGFGKSVYYRVGAGIVVFYSRIKENNVYKDRLIITLVEDENKTDDEGKDFTILNSIEPLSAGKAWWGYRDGEDLLPLTDTNEIEEVLNIFGIKAFKNNESGTSIIIPYISPKKLLDGIIPVESDIREDIKEFFTEVWTSTISDYLRLSIQKWYAPKIHNRELEKYNNKWLLVSVDNKPIRKQDLQPFFNLVQELYTTALAKGNGCDYSSQEFPKIETLPISITKYFSKGSIKIGYIAIIKVSRSELKLDTGVLSPYDFIGKFEADGGINEPIVMYARDPGMVIDYAITGAWVKGIIPPDSQEDFFFAFFVPISSKTIMQDFSEKEFAGLTLGEYLRECEASDHMGWNDPVKMQIVQRIQKNSIKLINKHIKAYYIDNNNIDATASKLSGRLGRSLLPRIGYGKPGNNGGGNGTGGGGNGTGGGGGTGRGGGTGGRVGGIKFDIISRTIKGNLIEMDFSLKLSTPKKTASLSLMVASEAGWIDSSSWAEEIGTEFPLTIKNCYIDNVITDVINKPYFIGKNCSEEEDSITTEILDVNLQAETDNSKFTQINFSAHIQSPQIFGTLKILSYDKKYQFTFREE